jgi:hypothetical protein
MAKPKRKMLPLTVPQLHRHTDIPEYGGMVHKAVKIPSL